MSSKSASIRIDITDSKISDRIRLQYSDAIENSNNLLQRAIIDYVSWSVDANASFENFGTRTNPPALTFEYGYEVPTLDTTVTLSILGGSNPSGAYEETGTNTASGLIDFVGNTGTYTDSSGDNFTIVVSGNNFTVTNDTDGWVFDSITGEITML